MPRQACHPPAVSTGDSAAGNLPVDPLEALTQLQATARGLEEQLIAFQRLALLGTLSATIVHEMNNLMTPILARAEFALGTGQPADMRKALERSQVQVQRAMVVIERLLALAKPGEFPIESCRVAAAVQEAIETTTRPFEKDGIDLHVSVPEDLHVRAQFDLLTQVLLNLLLNARQAMKGLRGKLTVSARRDGRHVVISICDNGKGIPPKRLADVINPFLAATDGADPSAWQSVGLGLKVCQIIVQRHGATIEALPNDDRGTTFRLHWPAGE